MPGVQIKILIIDDDSVDRKILQRCIAQSEFDADITSAADIESGIKSATENAFDCIFLDYNLPGNNGFYFLEEYKRKSGSAPVIMITSKGDEKLAVEAMKKGACDYIPKNLLNADSVSQLLRYTIKIREAELSISKTKKDLEDTERKLENIISSTPLIFFSINEHGIFNLFKGKGTKELNVAPEEIIGKPVASAENIIPVRYDDYKAALPGIHHVSTVEFNDHFYEIHYFPASNANEKATETNGIITDITTLKKNEDTLKISLSISEETQKVKELFLANMSHEIRTPIHGIMNLSDILLKTSLNEEQFHYLKIVKKSADNLLVIVNDILDLSKITAGKMTFETTPFKLKETVDVIMAMFKPRVAEKNIMLTLNYDESLPVYLLGDPVRLSQVINNLLANAVKFTHEGEVKLVICCEEINESYCLVSFKISDTGIGIPQHKLASIFDSFSQADKDTTRKYGGTGLGLSISKNIVELQGGEINVTSEINKGSVFTFRLAYKNNNEEISDECSLDDAPEEIFDKSLKILVVEDNEINRLVINKITKDWGFIIENAVNGTEAIGMVERNFYDAILMDIEMPGMNGYETTIYIRKHISEPKNNIPILAMTAHAGAKEKEKCKTAGMNDFISKPFDSRELKNKMLSLIQNKNGSSEHQEICNASSVSAPPLVVNTGLVEKITNLTFLHNLAEGNENFFRDFICMFLENAPLTLKEIDCALENLDWEGVRQGAHKIKPTLSYLGMKEAHKQAACVEDYARLRINLDETTDLIKQINNTCQKAFTELQLELKELTPQ